MNLIGLKTEAKNESISDFWKPDKKDV